MTKGTLKLILFLVQLIQWKRFVTALKDILKEINEDDFNEIKRLCCFSFSLLMNCTDLESLTTLYKIILFVFLSRDKNPLFTTNYNRLHALINERPHMKSDIEKVRFSQSNC